MALFFLLIKNFSMREVRQELLKVKQDNRTLAAEVAALREKLLEAEAELNASSKKQSTQKIKKKTTKK